ncbi:MAG: hypothetical protein ACREEB_06735 [Caulobacteraceae bacterium]
MADDAGAPNLQALTDTVTIAGTTRQDEFNLYNAARAAGNLDGLTAHFQGYQTALQVEQKANAVLAQDILNSPNLVTDLAMLARANARLAATAAALKADCAALNDFTQAACAALTVLGAIALL